MSTNDLATTITVGDVTVTFHDEISIQVGTQSAKITKEQVLYLANNILKLLNYSHPKFEKIYPITPGTITMMYGCLPYSPNDIQNENLDINNKWYDK